jgi:hypothetical protein
MPTPRARRRRVVLYGDSLTQRSFEPHGFGAVLVRADDAPTTTTRRRRRDGRH